MYVRHRGVALRKLRGPGGALVRGGPGARDVHPKADSPLTWGALAIWQGLPAGAAEMLGLVEGGGLPTVAELVKKYEEEGEEEEEEEQGEQPPAAGEAGPSEAPEPAEVGPVGPSMLLGEDAQEERREAPTSRRARGKEHAVQAMPPPETDEEMARCLQE